MTIVYSLGQTLSVNATCYPDQPWVLINPSLPLCYGASSLSISCPNFARFFVERLWVPLPIYRIFYVHQAFPMTAIKPNYFILYSRACFMLSITNDTWWGASPYEGFLLSYMLCRSTQNLVVRGNDSHVFVNIHIVGTYYVYDQTKNNPDMTLYCDAS